MPIKDIYGAWGGGPVQRTASVGEPLNAPNSSTTPLASGASFVGEYVANPCPDIMVSCYADQPGTLFFDFGIDNDTGFALPFPSAGFAVSAGIHEFHTAVKGPRYCRVRFVNGTQGDQTVFRLGTYFGTFRQGNAPLNQNLGDDSDAIVVRQIPQVVDLVQAKLGGIRKRTKFGSRDNLGTVVDSGDPTTWVDLWSYKKLQRSHVIGSTFEPYLASTDTGFTNKIVVLEYLDTGGTFRTVEVNTDSGNATTAANSGVTATECFRGYVKDDTGPAGDIIVAKTNNFGADGVPNDSGDVLFDIKRYDNQSQVLAFRIRKEHYGLLERVNLRLTRASGAPGSARAVLQIADITDNVWRTVRKFNFSTGFAINEEVNILVDPLTSVRIRVRDVSDNNSIIAGEINYLVIPV